MFKFLKSLVVKTAEVIEQKELEATEKRVAIENHEALLKKEKRLELQEFYNDLKTSIEKYFEPHVERLTSTIPGLHIKVGDQVIVNKYQLGRQSGNGWDSGANALTGNHYTFNDIHHGPIYAKIRDISVSETYFWDQVDKFLDHLGYSFLGYGMGEYDPELLNIIGYRFANWMKSRKDMISRKGMSITDEYGFYLDAHFDLIDIDFQPKWGLNIYSFLEVDSELGIKTMEAWTAEEDLHNLTTEYNNKKSELEAYKSSCFK